MNPIIKKSKKLSYLLRHHPEEAGIQLDAQGWTSVAELLTILSMDEDELALVVEQNDKNRFEWDRATGLIRARQGHSVAVDLGLTPIVPPETLFHGTVEASLPEIFREGLKPMGRRAVHLSRSVEVALDVAGRRGRGQAVILQVNARGFAARKISVFESTNGVFLVDRVPPELLSRLP